MPHRTIPLADGVDLIIDEPQGTSPSDRAALVASAVINEFGNISSSLAPINKRGDFEFKKGQSIFRIYYQYKANRVINALEAYSAAIDYIEGNSHLFDQRLSRKAIAVLRKCFKEELR
jgi:hypothetical protein